ncbi:DNA polymerase III subunit alpha [Erysipelotrichaceae bacterium OH741_COT-311]|nr:DNA polymerase III subunit alpha [Erysipelotrichaceae bacterium OH741_COT-311]
MTVHLHTRSSYSLLQSPIKIDDLIAFANAHEIKTLALTDYKSMHGVMHFNKECLKHGIKPIFGLELDIEIDQLLSKVLLIAKDVKGYFNLVALSSIISVQQQVLTIEALKKHLDGCFFIVYGEGGYFEHFFHNYQYEKGLKQLQSQIQDFIVAISYNDASYFKNHNQALKKVCQSYDVKTVALSKVYYLQEEDYSLYHVLNALRNNKTIHDQTLTSEKGRYFRLDKEMELLYDKDDLLYSDYLASQCHVELPKHITQLPKFPTKNHNSKEYLIELCKVGLRKRLDNQLRKDYVTRLKKELDVICSMGFEDYFLIVYDFIRYARSQKIYVGPGRGSAAGSLVAYCLGITHIDPIKYHLLFERFLNPKRISMPDIDVDFPDNRREEVIQYVIDKYGYEHIGHIVTFNTLACKQALKDVGRVLEIPLREMESITRVVPNTLKVTLTGAYQESSKFKQLIDSNKKYQELFRIALKLEGLPRHVSTHAAGIVISMKPLDQVIPIMKYDNMITTQYTMEYLEELGLIKMDFLGLRNLTIIDEIVGNIQKHHPFDLFHIDLHDKKTYEMIQKGDTLGVFQLESDGMVALLKKLKPEVFEDIACTIALFRPGPMQNIPLYLQHRQNKKDIEYLHKDLIPILKETYGIIVYQEQIMQISVKMANFSLAKADILRKAMSKKNYQEIESMKGSFIEGCVDNGYPLELAQELFDLILRFAEYGFNKSHSVAYGLISYQMAYLKANYPLFFYQSLLNSVIGSDIKTSEYIFQFKANGYQMLPPSINDSQAVYIIEQHALRFPLLAIKNVGNAVVTTLVTHRKEYGVFKDYFDFVVRASSLKINRKIIESLIDAGALDEFKIARCDMLASLEEALKYADLVKIQVDGQIQINMNLVSKPLLTKGVYDEVKTLNREKEVLGFYFSVHPIKKLRDKHHIQYPLLATLSTHFGYVNGFGHIVKVKQHRTKKGDLMAFVGINDESYEMDLVIMPNIYQKYSDCIQKGNYIVFSGKIEKEASCLVNKLLRIE